MKWYKYYKVYLGIAAFFTLSVIASSQSSNGNGLSMFPNLILMILFLVLGFKSWKKANADPELIAEQKQKAYDKLPPAIKYKDLTKIHAKIVGVTFNNASGPSRQKLVSALKMNDQLFLKEYIFEGKPAYYVLNRAGGCLGNLSEDMAKYLKKKFDTNEKLVFVERSYSFDPNENDYDDDDDIDRTPTYIYGCEIAIYIKDTPNI